MRIISGKFRGKVLTKSEHLKTLRPTTDSNREALFNILNSAKFLREIDFSLQESSVLDMCCGSGAVGFEALSRGANFVTFIDNDHDHLEITSKNAELLKVESQVEIMRCDGKKLSENSKHFDLVFIDPPYSDSFKPILQEVVKKKWANLKSLIVVEMGKKFQEEDFVEFKILEVRSYGNTTFVFCTLR